MYPQSEGSQNLFARVQINENFGAFAVVGYPTTSFRNCHRDREAHDVFLHIQFIICNRIM